MKEIEDKNIFLENKLKEEKEKIQKIKIDNHQKDEKINSLEKANELINKKVDALTIELEQLKNKACIFLNFISIENKWKEIDFSYRSDFKCCENKCIRTNKPIGNCIKGNGFVNLINDENIKYIKCGKGKGVNKSCLIIAENSFKEPPDSNNYFLFYFEIKCTKIEGLLNNDKNLMFIGLKMGDEYEYIRFGADCASILDNYDNFNIPQFTWNNSDVFGCGLVYPPDDDTYVFFTQNGKQIGKAVYLTDGSNSYTPYVALNCCSVETNFGNNLETKPFVYDISKHLVTEYY
ncbi:unnamed protein product [Meloidogyne enterolobii]